MNKLLSFATLFLKAYWCLTRPVTMGVQGVVADDQGRVLLVRHTYRPGWHFPGGGVGRGESAQAALCRELLEEVQVKCSVADLELRGIFYHRCYFKHDHYCVFRVRRWESAGERRANFEIAESRFFSLKDLPAELGNEARLRLDELRREQA